ncbi:MAG: hypothetical protein IT208_08755 [Chthonomonadales bacterium]|nr:hypothetical protein [Chthonomonadales bacterium]
MHAGTLPLLEKQGSNWTAAYAWGSGQIRRNGEYPLTDGHGSSRTLTDANQSVTGTADYAAFGQMAGTTGTSAEPYLYAGAWGYRSDGDAGLMLVGARCYDAQAGRFVTRDTLLSEHPYLYCEHEPVGSVDPSGHLTWWDAVKVYMAYWGARPITMTEPPGPPASTVGPPPPWWPGNGGPMPGPPPGPGPVGGGGAGGIAGGGAAATLIVGAATLYVGSRIVRGYADRIETFMDPDGDWATG